jgi:hypothetical protein
MSRIGAPCILLWCVLLAASVSSAGEPQALPDEIRSELDWAAGTWKMEGRIGQDQFSGVWSARWADGKHCLIRQSTGKRKGKDAEAIGISVIGWDAANKCITEQVFFSTGSSALLRWKVPTSEQWVGQMTGVEDGQEYTSKITATKENKDRFVYESKASTGDEVEILLTRIKTDKATRAK